MKSVGMIKLTAWVAGTLLMSVGAPAAYATLCTTMSVGTGNSCTFSTDTSGGTAIYENPANVINVGTGVIRPFLTVQADGTESGFSTDITPDGQLPLDDKRTGGGFTRTFSLSQLDTVLRGGQAYYEFFLDVNEPDNNPSYYISLDYLKIYDTGSSSDVLLGKTDITDLSQLDSQGWTPKYNLGSNSVLLNYDFFRGSGNGYDMDLLIPIGVFAGVNTSNRIVFANTFGLSGGTVSGAGTADGFEEWAALKGTGGSCPPGTNGAPPNCTPAQENAPEPGMLSLLAAGLLGLGFSKKWRRAS